MSKLKDLVKVIEDNDACVILEVLPDQSLELIKLGCFNGDEKLFRLTKGSDHTCTVFREDNSSYSWHWGYSGYTMVTDNMDKKGKLIQQCITGDFDIAIK